MSVPESEQTGGCEPEQPGQAEQPEQPASEQLGQQSPGAAGGKEPSGQKGETSECEKSVCEKGVKWVCVEGEQSVYAEGEPPVCAGGEKSVCEKREKSVCEKGGQHGGEQKKGSVSEQWESFEEGETDWKVKCDQVWKLKEDGIPTPDHLDWKAIFHKKPFGRNLLKSSNPEGLSTNEPPPPGPVDAPPPRMPLESYGDFSGWKVTTEKIPVDTSGIPPGVVVCYLPNYSWCQKEQMIDLVSEGLWAELMDSFQPEICIMDWYEDSKLHQFVYELHVKLIGADQTTVIQEFSLTPEDSMSGDSTGWKQVSHVFKQYGSGVRYVHFVHKSKDLFVVGFHRTRLTNTSVFVKLRE